MPEFAVQTLRQALSSYRRMGFVPIPIHDFRGEACSCPKTSSCQSAGKHPRVSFAAACQADDVVWEDWLMRWPNMNLGILTGAASGVVVIDIDPRHGGDVELERLEREHGPLNTLTVRTGGGGQHFYFNMPEGLHLGNSVGRSDGKSGIAPGIDVRGDGGLIVAPPSSTAAPYRWSMEPTRDAISELPPWLLKLITGPKPPSPAAPALVSSKHAQLSTSLDLIAEGGRNDFLFREVCALAANGLEGEVLASRAQQINQSRCRPPLPEDEVLQIVSSALRYDRTGSANTAGPTVGWGEPQPIESGLRAVPPFNTALLPPVVEAFVKEVAGRKSCPPDFPAIGCLIAISSLIGTKAFIRPKKHDPWLVPGGLWGVLVGSPGAMKSPPLKDALRPLEALEQAYAAEHRAKVREHEAQVAACKKSKVLLLQPEPPAHCRAIINDATYETLVAIAQDNPQGFLVHRDELAGVLHALSKDNQREARSFFLSAWSGDSSYATDRVGRGHLRADVVNFSLIGTIQPSVLQEHFRSAIDGGGQDDGLMQRLQLMVYPDQAPYSPCDEHEQLEIYSDYEEHLVKLSRLDALAQGAEDFFGKPVFRFDAGAQQAFDAWLDKLEGVLRDENTKLPPGLHGHYSKYRSLLPKLALTLHVAGTHYGLISRATLLKAMALIDYLLKHSKRIYALGEAARFGKASILAAKIKAGELRDGFTSTDILHRSWAGLKKGAEVSAALGLLCERGWIACYTDQSTGGRPAMRYLINPKITNQ